SDIEREGTKAVIVLTNLPDHYWGIFQSHFTPITAGGGIVLNDLDETLFIYRRGKWDLPKGKLDEGETIEECALREVKEETGLKIVELISKVGNTYHTYHEKKKHILKTTVWFKMLAPGHQELRPQTEEDIEEMVWSSPGNWNEVFSNTYPLIPIILERSVVK
ncbi:MAG TPA: NUDIX domain-containing protein, partial [Phnomibacter sp.]|nr:NUDIX domain-containing protein [Phnomibacter sp.]